MELFYFILKDLFQALDLFLDPALADVAQQIEYWPENQRSLV